MNVLESEKVASLYWKSFDEIFGREEINFLPFITNWCWNWKKIISVVILIVGLYNQFVETEGSINQRPFTQPSLNQITKEIY